MTLKLQAAARTDVGLVRRNNQDSFGSDEKFGIYVVCDGMGGAAGGEVASRIAADTFLAIARQELESDKSVSIELTRRALQRAAVAANRAVGNRALHDHRYLGMGSTLVGLRIEGANLTVINVGDSRAYLVRDGSIYQLTVDHSYVAEQVKLGLMTESEAERSNMQSLITRAIGAEQDVIPDLFQALLEPGDTMLLTSDGLTRHVPDHQIAELLSPESGASLDEMCLKLLDLAKEDGGSDNITCIVVQVVEAG